MSSLLTKSASKPPVLTPVYSTVCVIHMLLTFAQMRRMRGAQPHCALSPQF
jgi:hypothetical protein